MGNLLSSPPGIKYSINLQLDTKRGFIFTAKPSVRQLMQEHEAVKVETLSQTQASLALAPGREQTFSLMVISAPLDVSVD